jgi:hypothetical protein
MKKNKGKKKYKITITLSAQDYVLYTSAFSIETAMTNAVHQMFKLKGKNGLWINLRYYTIPQCIVGVLIQNNLIQITELEEKVVLP